MTHLIGYTKNNLPVYVDLFKSDAAKQIAREPHLLTLAVEVIQHSTLDKSAINLEYDMGRNIGYDFVVKTSANDVIFYVQLVRDSVYTRFTKNGKPLPTRYISIVLQRDVKDNSYWVDDIWIGHLAPPRPGSAKESNKSRTYWEDHAFVFGNQQVQSGTLTKTRPY